MHTYMTSCGFSLPISYWNGYKHEPGFSADLATILATKKNNTHNITCPTLTWEPQETVKCNAREAKATLKAQTNANSQEQLV